MRAILCILAAGVLAVCFGQKANPIVPEKVTFTPDDSSDRKVYVPPVPACTVIFYPVIREHVRIWKNDRLRLILRSKPKDSAVYTELFQWDFQLKETDSATAMFKVNIIP